MTEIRTKRLSPGTARNDAQRSAVSE